MLGALAFSAKAQTVPPAPAYQPYAKIDIADLEMKACDFEKDANAEVLIDKSDIYFDNEFNIMMDCHKRIKIFNDNGKGQADVHIEYINTDHEEFITGLQAETINLTDGKPEITKLDKKQIFTKIIDKDRSEMVFTFPNVKPGSIIEYKYTWNTTFTNFPNWYFQQKIPVRYSERSTAIPEFFYFRANPRNSYGLDQDVSSTDSRSITSKEGGAYPYTIYKEKRVIYNVHSLPEEPYMSSFADNRKCLVFQLVSIKPPYGFSWNYSDTWARVGGILADDEDFGGQLKRKLNNEEVIVNKAKALKTDDEKIAYIFGEVRNSMKWNGIDRWYTNDGTYRAWENKSGNSAEVNLILYHLLKQSGVDAYPMVVSTREHGKVIPFYTSLAQFNRSVVYVPVDSTKNYVLDATGKYNLYNETPVELLNSSGLYIDKSKKVFDMVYLSRQAPVRQVILINAEIKPSGKLDGTAQISCSSYDRINAVQRYKTDGEKKYIDYLRNADNNLKISSISFDNMDVDSLPLTQNVNFNLDLAGSDENYIYLNPNLFTQLKNNPFLSDDRFTDIEFGYMQSYAINGVYKLPAGFKVDALPKNVSMVMPDKSITFRRIVAEQDGAIIIRYSINYGKSEFSKDDYADFHEFYKKMHEMLNEQIILKKS